MEHVIMMHAKDNIAIVMAPSLAVGSEFTVGGKMVCAKDELPFAHKVAIKAIPTGGQIVKYGEPVGIATADIAPGEHNLDIMGANPAPDNIAGGLTTIEEKALGASKKGGTRPLVEVLE